MSGGVATARWHTKRFDLAVGAQGGTKEKEKVGHLVWAPVAQGGKDAVMWPAEALDAAALPQGRTIPREALASLNLTERNLVQQAIDSNHSLERAIALSLNEANAAGGGAAGSERQAAYNVLGGVVRGGRANGGRTCNVPKVFVVYFGSSRWAWLAPDVLLDFVEHRKCALAHYC